MSALVNKLSLALLLLASTVAFGQDQCSAKCSDAMKTCFGKCEGQPKCTSSCTSRMTDCIGRCGATPKEANAAAKKGNCVGADGRRMPCYDLKAKPGKQTVQPDAPDQYPNKAAKELMKDPKFKAGAVE